MPSMKPVYSVIIPTYNHGHLIGRCLSSVIAQTFQAWEAIVVNNYSQDNTIEVVEGFRDERVRLFNFSNKGVIAASRNEGIRQAGGDFIAFLDSDDWWYPKKLEIVNRYAGKADVIYHNLDIYTVRGRKIIHGERRRQVKAPVFIDLMVNWNPLLNSSVVVRRSIVEQVGGLSEDERLTTIEDFDLWLKIAMVTDNFIYINKKLGRYRAGQGNLSESSARHISRIENIFDKYLPLLAGDRSEQAKMQKAYLIGRIQQKSGLRDEAIRSFQQSRRSGNNIIRMKSGLLIVMLRLGLL